MVSVHPPPVEDGRTGGRELTSLWVFSGGREIKVMGSGFDLIQRATMKVLPSTDEFSEDSSAAEVRWSLSVRPRSSTRLLSVSVHLSLSRRG